MIHMIRVRRKDRQTDRLKGNISGAGVVGEGRGGKGRGGLERGGQERGVGHQ
jgi:hypothetical protein